MPNLTPQSFVLFLLAAFCAGAVLARVRASERMIRTCVRRFHMKFRLPWQTIPHVPPHHRIRLRMKLFFEEAFEWVDATYNMHPTLDTHSEAHQLIIDLHDAQRIIYHFCETAPIKVHLPKSADAMGDIDYIVEGSRQEYGIDGIPVLLEIQRANMAKVGGAMRHDGKVLKPAGWIGPDQERVLRAQGWDGTDGFTPGNAGPREEECSEAAAARTPPNSQEPPDRPAA
jgi:predicted HAD superfamily Cof-like phosphohydrolase